MSELGRFEGKVVLVTGPSDRGIGGAIIHRLSQEGARIAMIGIEAPKRVLKRLERHQIPHCWREADVTSASQVEQAIDDVVGELEGLDVVVNNAGIGFIKPFDQLTENDWQQMLDVNVTGAARVTRAALAHLSQPGGVIVHLASAMGMAGCRGYTLYGASKAAVIAMTTSLAVEFAPRGIRVVGVAPALVHTPMIHDLGEHLTREAWKRIQACHPLGVGTPQDVAAAVAFLASEDARWITGVTLPLGWTPQMPLPVDVLFDVNPT